MSEIFTVLLPDIGEGVVEGEVIEWLKAPGESVEQDEPVVLVMTDKATVELPAPYPGKLSKQHFAAGEVAIKDRPLYDIALEEGTEVAEKQQRDPVQTESRPTERPPAATRAAQPAPSPRAQLAEGASKVMASPPVRKLAFVLGVDINTVKGTGPSGEVTREDLARSVGPSAPVTESGCAAPLVQQSTPVTYFEGDEVKPLQGLRSIIAERMAESRYIVPDFSYFAEMEATRLVQLRENLKPTARQQGIRMTYMPFFLRALSLALKEFPMFNSSLDLHTRNLVIHKPHNIGIAVKTRLGLIVPVLKNVDQMNLEQIIRSYDDLVQRAQSHGLDPSEMRDATITISNFGTVGGVFATPIINYPEVCILGLGRIEKKPVVRKDQMVIRDMLNLCWTCDHRVVDGDQCATFSNYFVSLLQNPAQIL